MQPISFHLAIPAHDFDAAKAFYTDVLGFKLGRTSKSAAIINFAGHQVVLHSQGQKPPYPESIYPFHFGLNLNRKDWDVLAQKARDRGATFFREPKTRFKDEVTEHDSFFLIDPNNNLLEFKCYKHHSAIFGEQQVGEVGEDR